MPVLSAEEIAAGGGAVASREPRFIATRAVLYYRGLSGGVATSATYRQRCVASSTGDVSDPQLAYGGWYMPSTTETSLANNLTVRASIEYPDGTFYPVFFRGQRSVTIEPGAQVVSDPALGLFIPAGTTFRIRTYVEVGAGDKWPLGVSTIAANTEGNNLAAGGADLTTSGTPANATAYAYGPLAILGRTRASQRAIAIVGDSIAAGQGDSTDNRGFMALAINDRYGWCNLARPSEKASEFAAATNRAHRMGIYALGATDAVSEYGINDVTSGRSLAQIQADLQTIWRDLYQRGVKVYQTTITPVATSTDSFATLANQTTHANNSVRIALNAWIRTVPSTYLTGIFDVAAAVEDGGASAPTGKWIVTGAASYATADGTHPTNAGHTLMAAAVAL